MANGQQTDTVTCTIDGREVTVPKGTRIIEAAERLGIGIAHYCYHPALSAPAMCRMCLVEVEGAPKLQPACVSTVRMAPVIRTDAEKAEEARKGVLEFYLVNHPLDCPICDESGECKLQDFVHQEGPKHGRFKEPKRVLGQDDFGGDVVYDGDRCIMCTRCVRFMREMHEDEQLCVVQRGNRVGHRHLLRRPASRSRRSRATSSISARSARSSRRTSSTRRGHGTWTARRPSARTARRAATSRWTRATTSCSG